MNIGIDARYAVRNKRGIGKYVFHLIEKLALLAHKDEIYVYIDNESSIFPVAKNINVRVIKGNYVLWENVLLPYNLWKDNIEVFHSTANTGPFFLTPKLVLTIHDVMFLKKELKFGNLFQYFGNIYRKINFNIVAKKADRIVAVSEFTKFDITQESKIKNDKIIVTWESYDEIFDDTSIIPYKTNKPYIISLGAIDPRKNSEMIVKSFAEVRKHYDVKLIMCGFKGWSSSSSYKLANKLNLLDYIHFEEYVSDQQLASYYRGAVFFLYPSLYEGFGIPPLEAMACSCPVITSNLTSIPEITGDAAYLLNELNLENLSEACLKLLSDETLMAMLSSKGIERIKQFSWLKMAKMTYDIYKK
jgi:glycosyltransferase involved in cell wall biosynthesis